MKSKNESQKWKAWKWQLRTTARNLSLPAEHLFTQAFLYQHCKLEKITHSDKQTSNNSQIHLLPLLSSNSKNTLLVYTLHEDDEPTNLWKWAKLSGNWSRRPKFNRYLLKILAKGDTDENRWHRETKGKKIHSSCHYQQ